MTMTDWIKMLKSVFHSKYSAKEIRDIIVSECLISPKRIDGTYCVDHQKVWEHIVEADDKLKEAMLEKRITDVIGVLSYYEEIQYKRMRATYPKNHHKH